MLKLRHFSSSATSAGIGLEQKLRPFLKVLGYYSEESINGRAAYHIYRATMDHSQNKQFQKCMVASNWARNDSDLGLDSNFRSEFHIETLHTWMMLSRLREVGAEGKTLSQALFDQMWEDMGRRIHKKGVRPFKLCIAHIPDLDVRNHPQPARPSEGVLRQLLRL